jgi:hypothetical protein
MLKASYIQGEGSIVYGVQKKLEHLLLAPLGHEKMIKYIYN